MPAWPITDRKRTICHSGDSFLIQILCAKIGNYNFECQLQKTETLNKKSRMKFIDNSVVNLHRNF